MKQSIEKILQPLNTFWEGMDKGKKTRLIILSSVIVLAIIVSAVLLSREEYVVLYKNMEAAEAGEVLNKLEEMKVKARPQGTGTILVPKKSADAIRMQLSAEGYPKSALNYDLFQNSMSFGATDFEKQKYLQFQLQERLQSAIKTLDLVEDAVVTLNIPDNSSFVLKEDKQAASASVLLKLRSGRTLGREQIKGIVGLVSKSVPGLAEDQVFIIDSMGNSLKANTDLTSEIAGTQLELEETMGKKLQSQILQLLEPVFGKGRVNAGVRVVLDFDEQTTESLRFDPITDENRGIAVSESTEREQLRNGGASGNVGQDPNGGAPQYMQSDRNDGQYQRENTTTNYEVNQLRETIKKAQGQIKDISVSVLLDNKDLPMEADLKVKEIVAGALGIDEYKVVVGVMEFSGANEIESIMDSARQKEDYLKRQALIRNSIVFGVLGLILLTALIILLARRRKQKEDEAEKMLEDFIDEKVKLTTDDIDLSVNKSDKRALIEKSIEKNPELVAQLLRNWLKDDVR